MCGVTDSLTGDPGLREERLSRNVKMLPRTDTSSHLPGFTPGTKQPLGRSSPTPFVVKQSLSTGLTCHDGTEV